MFRQGDVLVEKLAMSKLPETAVIIPNDQQRTILAYGEVTGHAHALDARMASLYTWEGNRLLEVTKTTSLKHEEHAAITLEPGIYKVTQQREYTPGAIRNVAD